MSKVKMFFVSLLGYLGFSFSYNIINVVLTLVLVNYFRFAYNALTFGTAPIAFYASIVFLMYMAQKFNDDEDRFKRNVSKYMIFFHGINLLLALILKILGENVSILKYDVVCIALGIYWILKERD